MLPIIGYKYSEDDESASPIFSEGTIIEKCGRDLTQAKETHVAMGLNPLMPKVVSLQTYRDREESFTLSVIPYCVRHASLTSR